jgi:hypothetical protein
LVLFLPNIALPVEIEADEIRVRVDVIDPFNKLTTNANHNIFTIGIVDLYLEVANLVLGDGNLRDNA